MSTMALLQFVGWALAGLIVAVTLNVINQLLFYKRNEPPVVFHWLPFIGSTVTYGMDPLRFFLGCKEKVREPHQMFKVGQ